MKTKWMIFVLVTVLSVSLCQGQIPVFQDIAPSAGVNNGGLGVGEAFLDVNNDRMDDIHLINDSQGNEHDHLYLNQGDLAFDDITLSAGVWDPPFSTSVRVADIDNDGWQKAVGSFATMAIILSAIGFRTVGYAMGITALLTGGI